MFPNNKEWTRTENFGMKKSHAYFIPFDKKDGLSGRKENSSRVQSLNGEWDFCEHENLFDCELSESLDCKIPVPACVQYHGYDHMQYTNHRYPFPYNPPFIEKDIPTFHYRKTFSLKEGSAQRSVRLVFEGVDSAFYAFLNGELLGYSQISHKTTEFELSRSILKEENTLDVIVLKWCASSYLEDQDKWRFSGIFRDVYLLYRDKECVEDYKITTSLSNGEGIVNFKNLSSVSCSVKIESTEKEIGAGEEVYFTVKEPKLWSAEEPNLYDLSIACGDEIICEKVGFRTVIVQNGEFLFNGKPIKLLGMNRHEFHPDRGCAITYEDMLFDLKLMKSLHINAIRTSHYPDMPEFYKLCDEMGFYVVNEADIEAHGVVDTDGNYDVAKYNDIANSPIFESAICERVLNMYERDKNRSCIVMWSLGNEAGYGVNFIKAAEELKKLDSRPVHFEQHVNVAGTDEYYNDPIDVASRMYFSTEWMRDEFLKDERETRPFMLCEYCHAMGNGPGDLREYWETIRSNNRFIGGFIWEWADHGARADGRLNYGGDFGETLHDGNFCIDGIVTSDREIKSGTLEMKYCYQPAEFSFSDDKLSLKNRYYFINLKGELNLTVKVKGETVWQKRELIDLKAGESAIFEIEVPEKGFAGLHIELIETNQNISSEFFVLKESPVLTLSDGNGKSESIGRLTVLSNEKMRVEISNESGNIISIKKGNEEILTSPVRVSALRAPIDNENPLLWYYSRIDLYESNPRVHLRTENGSVICDGLYLSDSRRSVLNYVIGYSLSDEGLKIEMEYEIPEYVTGLPCVGLRFALGKENENIKYFGYGDVENYCDLHAATNKDWHEQTAQETFFPYLKPQETGNRRQTEEVVFGKTLRVRSLNPVDFSAIPYSEKQLIKAKHNFELENSNEVHAFFGVQSGLGSAACGPNLAERYTVPKKGKFTFIFELL